MQALHIITGLNDGGAEAVLYRLCTQDEACRHHVISLMDGGKYATLLEEKGISVTSIGMPRGRITLSGLWRLWRLVRQIRPDVIQTWMYHADLLGGIVARLAGIRNVCWGVHHTTLIPGRNSRSTIMVASICARLSRLVPRHIIYCAERSRDVHVALGYDASHMSVIPNGYDLAVFQPDRAACARVREEINLKPKEPVIGFVARYDPQKDHENLLKALSLLKSRNGCPKCLLVGTDIDSDNEELVKQIETFGLMDRVHLLGRRNDVPAIMNALDVHVMSSAFGEAFPNVLSEAMACGTPCVSTDVGDAAIIVGDTGWVVPPGDPQALAEAIRQALDELAKPGWAVRQAFARERVATRFSMNSMVDSYRKVWFGKAADARESVSSSVREA